MLQISGMVVGPVNQQFLELNCVVPANFIPDLTRQKKHTQSNLKLSVTHSEIPPFTLTLLEVNCSFKFMLLPQYKIYLTRSIKIVYKVHHKDVIIKSFPSVVYVRLKKHHSPLMFRH